MLALTDKVRDNVFNIISQLQGYNMATKKAATKRKTTARSTKSTHTKKRAAVKSPKYETLKLTKKDMPFFNTRLTVQTFYWTLISFLVLIFGLWIIYLQYSVHNLYQRLEIEQQQTVTVPAGNKD